MRKSAESLSTTTPARSIPGTSGEIQLAACQPVDAQRFTLASDGTMRVLGRCVAVESTDNGAHLQVAGCDGDAAQQFTYNAATYDLVSTQADKCVDVPDGGNPAQIWGCNGTGNQKWHR